MADIKELTKISGECWNIFKKYHGKNMVDKDFEQMILVEEKELIAKYPKERRFCELILDAYNTYLGEVNR